MRIISGIFRGKKILIPKDNKTRPLKDLAKESIFNVINHSNKCKINLYNSHILDLFSGVGSFGIECLSRGAKKVIFVENYRGVLPILKKNLIPLKLNDNFKIIEEDIYNEINLIKLNLSYDIIFLDPPYREKKLEEIFLKIKLNKLLKKNGIIILHRHKKDIELLPEFTKIIEEKKYGISKIYFLKIN